FFFSSRRRHTRSKRDWSSDVCSSDLRIAAHLANAGLPVVLLDIPTEGGARSAIAAQALDALKKSKPAAFYDPAYAARVTVGNFEIGRASCREGVEVAGVGGCVVWRWG